MRQIKTRKIWTDIFFIASLGLAGFLILPKAQAAVLIYPGSAPCNTTLQACINGAASGDTIQIASNDRIDETLTVSNTLTLTSADGFTGLIGSDNELTPNTILIEDPGSGETIGVVFSNLNFDNAKIYVSFSGGSDHRFTVRDSTLYDNNENNNDGALELNVRVNSTVVIERNRIVSAGPGIYVSGSINVGESSSVSIVNNEITGANPPYSYQGIQIRNVGDGDLNVDVLSNLIYSVGGCFCGSNSGLNIYNNAVGNLLVNAVNNTIWDVKAEGTGLYVYNPGGTGICTINFYNNTVSGGSSYGLYLPAVSSRLIVNNDNNNFFDNADGEFWNGYTPGAGNINVDPDFRDAVGGDFRLQQDSELIDAGVASIAGVDLSDNDIFGNTRVIGDSVDVGAAETNTDLNVSVTSSSTSLGVGASVIYFVTVSNVGSNDSSAELSASLSAGELFFASFSQGSCSNTTTSLSCSLGTLSPGDSASVAMAVLSSVTGSITNSVTVTGTASDINSTNNNASIITTVTAATEAGSEDDDAGGTTEDPSGSADAKAASGGCSLFFRPVISSYPIGIAMALYLGILVMVRVKRGYR